MGAWGAGSFENDDAADWKFELEDSSDWSLVRAALEVVTALAPDAYLEAPEASISLAAAEVTAAALGAPADDLPDEVREWIGTHGDGVRSTDARDASRVVERVASASELAELWQESASAAEWQARVVDLHKRLAGASGKLPDLTP